MRKISLLNQQKNILKMGNYLVATDSGERINELKYYLSWNNGKVKILDSGTITLEENFHRLYAYVTYNKSKRESEYNRLTKELYDIKMKIIENPKKVLENM
jgi:hypothetical protein